MATLFLVRHGQASFGSANYDCLSDTGRQQARWLGEYFAGRGVDFTRVVAGSMVRQQDTAREILAGMGRTDAIETHAGLNEYDGEALFRAYTRADAIAHQNGDRNQYWRTFRQAYEAWTEGGLGDAIESWHAFGARIAEGIAHATEGATREQTVLVVSSGGVIGRAVADLLHAPARAAVEMNLQFRNSAFCEIVVGRGTRRLVTFNTLPHLDREDRRASITLA